LFQDSAMTVPVAADGDPVGAMLDKSGNGNHMLQATAANRPLYKTSGGLHWIESDGVNDLLSCSSRFGLGANPALTVVAAVRPISYGLQTDRVWFLGSNVNGSISGAVGTGNVSWRHINGNAIYTGVPTGSDYVLSWWRSAGDTYIDQLTGINGVESSLTSSSSPTNVPTDTTAQFTLFAQPNGAAPGNMRLYGAIIAETDNSLHRAVFENYLAAKGAITL